MNKHTSKLKNIGLQFFAMKSLDVIQQERAEIMQRMTKATQENDTEAFSAAFGDLAESIQQAVMGDFREMQAQQDTNVLTARGCRVLTSTERTYYESIMDAMRSENPKQALSNVNRVLPETVIDSVFEDMKAAHPLLSAIKFESTGALIKMLLSTTGGVAVWGSLGTSATADSNAAELTASFAEVNLTLAQLIAFIPVSKYMLEMGPEWMDRYVRELLVEALATQLEVGAVAGTGASQPIGMIKKLTGAVDGVYPTKDATSITDLGPATFGTICNILSQGPNSKRRAVGEIIMLVNPQDYYTKVYPAVTPRSADGTFAQNVLPYPCQIIQTPAISAGKALFGIASKYFMGIGTQSGGKLEYDDSVKFLDRQRAYLIYLYGYGRALDENAFVYCDISKLREYALPVAQVEPYDCRLASLAIGAKTLVPAFDKNIYNYTCATTDATNTITTVAKDGEATMVIKNGSTTVTNGSAATWAAGDNTVTVKVTNGDAEKTYTVTVTKSGT